MEEQLTTRQVAEALKVSESSVKRWCDSGVIPTVRTVGGHRRIPVEGFKEFLASSHRQVVTPFAATRVGETGGIGKGDTEPWTEDSASSTDELKHRFHLALAGGDEADCCQILTSLYARTNRFCDLADEFIAATLRAFGTEWNCGALKIYQERRGCEICARLLHELRRLIPEPPANGPLAIGGSPAGDRYTLATQLCELVLRESGWRAVNLGTNLPLETMALAAAEYRPRMLWLSVSHLEDVEAFIADYQTLCRSLAEGTLIVLGGRALTDELRPRLKYTGHCDNMRQLAEFATALHGRRPAYQTSTN